MRAGHFKDAKLLKILVEQAASVLTFVNCQATEYSYTFPMSTIEEKLNCERHIADLKLRIAQLKEGSHLGSDVLPSGQFIDLLQQTLDSWEERKKTLTEPVSERH